ncbi:uncharacterized protein DUF262 [Saccharopolyspora spinosa]|uniref:Uncharacterized protein DUF262 n=1 Tax=Saccharopolyspora spinosa TaxID=60894 RepID=A0A2N3Y6C6_SACSN|nr:DUF262 domain-containing protein [Saccharopolyspora spinosa]PKW18477.1 uncharacterized protein DUF262 [Saccharopolyspora spinosa]
MVVARQTVLQELLEGSKQYQVPLYQRTYSWSRRHLERLWEDLVKRNHTRITTDPGVPEPRALHLLAIHLAQQRINVHKGQLIRVGLVGQHAGDPAGDRGQAFAFPVELIGRS